jgi:hypothetical protein
VFREETPELSAMHEIRPRNDPAGYAPRFWVQRGREPGNDRPLQKGTATMKLTTTTMVTVDGVMQGLGGPDEDRRGGFERGGWVTPYADTEAMGFLNEVYGRADAFLFGRRTYEIFAGSWGTWDDPGDSPIWTALNTKPKYVGIDRALRPRVGEHDRPVR